MKFVEVAQKKERGRRRLTPAASYRNASKSVSRVLYLTVIYLAAALPQRSSHPGSGRASLLLP